MPKQAEAKRDGVINPQNYNFNQFLTREILMQDFCQDFSGVQRQNYWSDKYEQSYAVTYYKITPLSRGPFCLCFII